MDEIFGAAFKNNGFLSAERFMAELPASGQIKRHLSDDDFAGRVTYIILPFLKDGISEAAFDVLQRQLRKAAHEFRTDVKERIYA